MPRGAAAADDAASDTIATAASWPWNLSTVPTGTSVNPAASSASRTSVSCALYGVTTMRSRCCSGRAGAAASVASTHARPSSSPTRPTTAAASSGEEVALPACAIGTG